MLQPAANIEYSSMKTDIFVKNGVIETYFLILSTHLQFLKTALSFLNDKYYKGRIAEEI